MNAMTTRWAVCLALLAVPGTTWAQCCGSTSSSYNARGHYPAYHGGPALLHHHASTAAEGYARGIAAILYAQAVHNRLTAEARAVHAQAYAMELENRQRAVDTFFNLRATNSRARAAEAGDRPTFEELAKLAKDSAPPRLDAAELDPVSGEIHWPAALLGPQFAAYRAELEKLFRYRAATGKVAAERQTQVAQLADAMLTQLKDDIRHMSPMEYTKARGFLRSLAYEGQFAVA